MDFQILLIPIIFLSVIVFLLSRSRSGLDSKSRDDFPQDQESISDEILRTIKSRRDYYRDVYLKSDAWQRKRYVVLKRDNWTCVYCGARATQVHHKKYARKNIGKEPIDWVCKLNCVRL
jgi:hypothetical protein